MNYEIHSNHSIPTVIVTASEVIVPIFPNKEAIKTRAIDAVREQFKQHPEHTGTLIIELRNVDFRSHGDYDDLIETFQDKSTFSGYGFDKNKFTQINLRIIHGILHNDYINKEYILKIK